MLLCVLLRCVGFLRGPPVAMATGCLVVDTVGNFSLTAQYSRRGATFWPSARTTTKVIPHGPSVYFGRWPSAGGPCRTHCRADPILPERLFLRSRIHELAINFVERWPDLFFLSLQRYFPKAMISLRCHHAAATRTTPMLFSAGRGGTILRAEETHMAPSRVRSKVDSCLCHPAPCQWVRR